MKAPGEACWALRVHTSGQRNMGLTSGSGLSGWLTCLEPSMTLLETSLRLGKVFHTFIGGRGKETRISRYRGGLG